MIKRYKLNLFFILLLLMLACAVLLFYVLRNQSNIQHPAKFDSTSIEVMNTSICTPTPTQIVQCSPEPTLQPTPVTHQKIKLAAVGDIIVHDRQLENGYDEATDTYRFDGYFTSVKKYIQEADIAFANLETTLAGKEEKYTGYPRFNSPEVIATVLKGTGFDLLSTANNHCLDRSFSGLLSTLDQLDSIGLMHTGTFRSMDEQNHMTLIETNKVKLAFFAYTYSTNGVKVPAEKTYAVNLIDKTKMIRDIAAAKEQNADLIVFSMHFGTEYQSVPDHTQKELTDFLFKNGVDIILGSHPHVLEPIEIRKVTVNGVQKNCCVAYSMGNFISKRRELDRASSAILQIEIEKDLTTQTTTISNVSYIPTFVDMSLLDTGKYDFRVISMEEGIYDYEHQLDPLLTEEDYNTLKVCYNQTVELLGRDLLWKHSK